MPQNATSVQIAKAVANGASFAHYNAATAGNQAKTGQGVLRAVLVNTAGAGSTITLYDGTSTAGAVIGAWSGAAVIYPTDINIQFTTGLFVVIAGGTAPDATIVFN